MKILFLSHCVPFPPNKGEKIRAYNEIRYLAERNDVSVLALARYGESDAEADALRGFCELVEVFPLDRKGALLRVAVGFLQRSKPLTLSYFWSRSLATRVKELSKENDYDVVMAYTCAMAPYADLVSARAKVLDLVDVDSSKWSQYSEVARFPKKAVYALESGRLRTYEKTLGSRFDRLFVTTSRELNLLHDGELTGGADAIRNGVDFDFYGEASEQRSANPRIVFTGQMDYFGNESGIVHFAVKIFPSLRRRFPDLELHIVGRSPTVRVRKLAEMDGVTVTGEVPDIRPFLRQAWVFVAPLQIAQGVQNKVLEAMATGLPVVCSERVMSGLLDGGFRPGQDVMVAASDTEFEEKTAALISDAELRMAIAKRARRQVLESYSWDRNMNILQGRLLELAGAGVLDACANN